MRWSASSRTVETSRASTLTPGNSTRSRRNHALACSNNATAPSTWIHARALMNSSSGSRTSGSAKSRYPYAALISHACSYAVFDRSVYRLITDGSAMSSYVLHRRPGNLQRILGQEVAQVPHRPDLHRHE
jgi:hypothetical protein